MLAPYGSPTQTNLSGEYADYVTTRGGIAGVDDGGLALPKPRDPSNPVIWKQGLLRIQDPISGRYFGMHPGIGQMRTLFNEGALSFIANVGSLVEPTTISDYNTGLNLPLGLFSHSDLIRHWQTADPGTRSQKTGWGGRLADQLDPQNTPSPVAMNISLNGVNVFQTGAGIVPYVVSPSGATALTGIGNLNGRDRIYAGFTN